MVRDIDKREKLATAQQWLDGWGAVVHERRVTGDPSAVPRGEFGGMHRGKPGLPQLWEVYMGVEGFIAEWNGERIRAVLELAHITCVEHVVSVVAYTMADGTVVELDHREEPPLSYLSAEPRMVTIRKRPDWRRISIPKEVEAFHRVCRLSRYRYWANLYRDFKWALIDCRIYGKLSLDEWEGRQCGF